MLDPIIGDNLLLMIFVKASIAGSVFLGIISLIAMFSIWWERKVAAHIQGRVGPMHTGMWHGWAQSLADGIKLILKEDLMPRDADSFLFRFAPYVAFGPVFAAFLIIPFGPQFVFEQGLNIGVLYLLAVLAVEVMGTIMAGWGSNSKWSIYGAMREACQMVSYEIPLGVSILCGLLVAGTLNLLELSYLQGGGIQDWFIFHNPFVFLAFAVYFVASLASNKRAPFDLPESESELVSGFHTEYSGLRWSFFFFAEYAGMFVVGAIQAILFLGAWNSGLGRFDPVHYLLGYDAATAGQAYFSGAIQAASGPTAIAEAMGMTSGAIGLIVLNIWAATILVIKTMTVIYVQMWLRWTLPRIRIDQVLYACVKVLLPASLILMVGTAAWIWLVPQAAPVVLNGERISYLGHLTGTTPIIQMVTQIVLAVIGVGILGTCVGVVLFAWLHYRDMSPKTFFPDVMPVGKDINFTGTRPSEAEAAG